LPVLASSGRPVDEKDETSPSSNGRTERAATFAGSTEQATDSNFSRCCTSRSEDFLRTPDIIMIAFPATPVEGRPKRVKHVFSASSRIVVFSPSRRFATASRARSRHRGSREIVSPCATLPIIDTLWLQVAPFLCLSLVKHGARWSARHHKTVLEALESRRPRAARRGIERDIEETLSYLLKRGVFAD
jgi:hypothetical protein